MILIQASRNAMVNDFVVRDATKIFTDQKVRLMSSGNSGD
jgi:hypothetical protein